MKKPIVHITDHALVRYMERVLLMDVEALRRRIGREVDVCLIEKMPEPCGVKVNGINFRLKDNNVTTCTLINQNGSPEPLSMDETGDE